MINKYKAKKVIFKGIKFDSEMEANYYMHLLTKYREQDIEIQPKFTLIPSFRDNKNQLIRAITYTADFRVGKEVIDIKGMSTQQGEMRIKMFKRFYPDYELKVLTKAPKYTGLEWIELKELKKIRKERKAAI